MLTTRVVSVSQVSAGRSVANDLGILPGDPTVHLERVRSIADEPLLLETTDLPAERFPGVEVADFASRSLYDILREDYDTVVEAAIESLEPVILTPHESTLLGLPRHAPAMLIRRVSTDQTGAHIELSHLLLRGDRSRFLLERRVRDAWAGAPSDRQPTEARCRRLTALPHPCSSTRDQHRFGGTEMTVQTRPDAAQRWLGEARAVLDRLEATQLDPIERAADLFARTIAADGLRACVRLGSLADEYRGDVPADRQLPRLSPDRRACDLEPRRRRRTERPAPGHVPREGRRVRAGHPAADQAPRRADAFLIFSSTGINGVVIEVALYARAMGLPVVAGTSLDHSRATASRHLSARKLAEVADVVIDNASPAGDAAVEIDGLPFKVGPTSSVGAIAVVNMLKTRTAERMVELGVPPVVLTSPHFVGQTAGAEQLERVYEEYFRRVTRAYDPVDALVVPESVRMRYAGRVCLVAGSDRNRRSIRAPLRAGRCTRLHRVPDRRALSSTWWRRSAARAARPTTWPPT